MSPVLFIDRDGTLIEEPADEQIDSYAKFRLVTGVIPALIRLKAAGYRFVMVSNQDGLGSERFPLETFTGPHELLLQILDSQGVGFDEVLIDHHFPADNAPTRKPGIGMVLHWLRDPSWDRARSAVIGDRDTDLELAQNMGLAGYRISAQGQSWAEVATRLLSQPRRAEVRRVTRETQIVVEVDLDSGPQARIATGLGFFDHMLEQISRHGGIGLAVQCSGDLHIDEHHTVEDCALALGQALRQALGDKRGIGRYGAHLPMDETRAEALLDLSGRPYLKFAAQFPRERVGELPTELVEHFFRSLCDTLGANLHLRVDGDNAHHMVEGAFKAFARALGQAVAKGSSSAVPSSKGVL